MPTLKEYLEEQRKEGKTPYFTNIPGEGPEDAFRYGEQEFSAETERLLEDPASGFTYTENLPEGMVPRGGQPIPEKPTAETVTPGGEIPEEYRKKHGLSKEARWAADQKIPAAAAAAIPEKPPADVGSKDFADRRKYRDFVVKKIETRGGVNPLKFNPQAEVEKSKELLPKVFKDAFGGRVAWISRDNLNPEQKKIWEAAQQTFFSQVENNSEFRLEGAKKELAFGMKIYDEKVAEKAKIPKGMEASLESIYIEQDESGKAAGKIPAGELANAVKLAEDMVNRKNMSAPEAINQVTSALIGRRARKQSIADAIGAIPEMDTGWFDSDAKNVKIVQDLVQDALGQGATEQEVRVRLSDQGWNDKNIAKVFPQGEKKAGDVSHETPGGQYDSPEAVRAAWKEGAFGPPESKESRAKAKELIMPFHKG